MRILGFTFNIKALAHYNNNEKFIGYLNEIEHLVLINFIAVNHLDGYYFFNTELQEEKIIINSDGTYNPSFNGYGTIENILLDSFSIKNNVDELIYDYKCIEPVKSRSPYINDDLHFNDCKSENFKIGDVVSIIDYGKRYDTFSAAFKYLKINKPVEYHTNNIFVIQRIINHPSFNKKILVYMKNINNEDCLISIEGIQKINES